jgi:hypothetical protein
VAVSDGYDDEETTPVFAERGVSTCMPCVGRGAIYLADGRRERMRPCPVCRGAGVRVIMFRGGKEVFVADEMKVADLGRCRGSFHTGRRAAFGRVACGVCGGRFRPLQGLRVPNHVAVRDPPKP